MDSDFSDYFISVSSVFLELFSPSSIYKSTNFNIVHVQYSLGSLTSGESLRIILNKCLTSSLSVFRHCYSKKKKK